VGRIPITVMGYKCERCMHEWIPLDFQTEPEFCPKCESRAWDKAKGPMLTYENFSNKIAQTLKSSSGPLTWTEIRTLAGLPQKFPNNEWVRRMERDIGLKRTKDGHGIINWELSWSPEHA
jgi:DNA-directed RNA polymerase subunit RPC12/RpoP